MGTSNVSRSPKNSAAFLRTRVSKTNQHSWTSRDQALARFILKRIDPSFAIRHHFCLFPRISFPYPTSCAFIVILSYAVPHVLQLLSLHVLSTAVALLVYGRSSLASGTSYQARARTRPCTSTYQVNCLPFQVDSTQLHDTTVLDRHSGGDLGIYQAFNHLLGLPVRMETRGVLVANK